MAVGDLVPPWDDATVAALNDFQRNGRMHPFTCPNRGDGNHRRDSRDLGLLEATANGWRCPDCDYTQQWAHPFMATGEATGDPFGGLLPDPPAADTVPCGACLAGIHDRCHATQQVPCPCPCVKTTG